MHRKLSVPSGGYLGRGGEQPSPTLLDNLPCSVEMLACQDIERASWETNGVTTLVRDFVVRLAVYLVRDGVGQGFRRAVEHDPAGRHTHDAAAVGTGRVQRMQVGQAR